MVCSSESDSGRKSDQVLQHASCQVMRATAFLQQLGMQAIYSVSVNMAACMRACLCEICSLHAETASAGRMQMTRELTFKLRLSAIARDLLTVLTAVY